MQVERGEQNEASIQKLSAIPLLALSLPQIEKLRANADQALKQSVLVLKASERLADKDELRRLHHLAAVQLPGVDLLLKIANRYHLTLYHRVRAISHHPI